MVITSTKKYGSHLDGGVCKNVIWNQLWSQVAAQYDICYTALSWKVGQKIMAVMSDEGREVIKWKWYSKINLVFKYVILIITQVTRRVRGIYKHISYCIYLC